MDIFQNLLHAALEDAMLGLSSTESKPRECFQTHLCMQTLKIYKQQASCLNVTAFPATTLSCNTLAAHSALVSRTGLPDFGA